MTARCSNFEIKIFLFSDVTRTACFEAELFRIRSFAHRTQSGKPYLHGVACFGFSDAAGMRAYLVSNRKYVGLDVESYWRPDLAVRQVRLEPMVSRTDVVDTDFLSRWVVKEACAKALGLGLLETLPYLSIRETSERDDSLQQYFLLRYRHRGFAAQCLNLTSVKLGVGYRLDYGVPQIELWSDLTPIDLENLVVV